MGRGQIGGEEGDEVAIREGQLPVLAHRSLDAVGSNLYPQSPMLAFTSQSQIYHVPAAAEHTEDVPPLRIPGRLK